jgi:glycosyltransferase involved in cell wall biosynthesis
MFALHYTPVKTPAEENKIFGLQVAVLEWVKAWFRHGTQEVFYVLVDAAAGQKEIENAAAAAGLDRQRLAVLDQRYARENFGRFETIFRADADPKNLLWQREQLPHPRFNFCGLTHATSGIEGGSVLEQYCLAPTHAGDAIICPSQAVAKAIRAYWDHYGDYLRARFKTEFKCPVQLPVIPLGIDNEAAAARASPDKRAAQRGKLGLGETDVMLLWVGRLSHAIKAHPLAMFQAAERAAELTGAQVHLVMQGYFVPQEAEVQFGKLAKDVCRKAKVTFVASDDKRFPDGLWAAGDIFLSLVDNMQESFGLAPIEAMAAGLPRVVSDWDGYRDSVQDGEDGFLIRTTTPPRGAGQELADLLLNGRETYGGFLAKTALCTAVDHEMAARAIKTLIEDKNKRRAIVEKARRRATTYDWWHIIPAYEGLWRELKAKRPPPAVPLAWHKVPDPFAMYAGYPTAALTESDRVNLALPIDVASRLLAHDINAFALDIMIGPDDISRLLLAASAADGISIGEMLQKHGGANHAALWRTVGWLLKLGIFKAAG